MCGIWAILLKQPTRDYYDAFQTLKPRGPDRSYLVEYYKPFDIKLGFHRLSIMDPSTKGDQPFVYEYDQDGKHHILTVICNGEIYNYMELALKYNLELKSGSDCEVLHLLYHQIGIDALVKELNGEFAFVICDMTTDTGDMIVQVARDPFGVRPLFISVTDSYINLSSELKALVNVHNKTVSATDLVEQFKPGHYMTLQKQNGKWLDDLSYVRYYSCALVKQNMDMSLDVIKSSIVEKLTEAVRCRLTSDRPLGCLLSGGLDSSLVSSIASRELAKTGRKLRTFSIGMPGSTDEKYAKMVAEHIGSIHTHVCFQPEQFLEAVDQVIYAIETYDITTIRASTAQYLICKWISENTDIKVLLIGDGSDELTAGYLYFHKAPNSWESHCENIRLLEDICYFDVLRADRGVASNGLEARVPFLQKDFVDFYLSVDPDLRVPKDNMEKWLLRTSFDNRSYLPREALWRCKCALSDGCSSEERSWFKILQDHLEDKYTDEQLLEKKKNYTHFVPQTKEALYFREKFEEYFGKKVEKVVPYQWLPKFVGNTYEPSARTLDIYKQLTASI